MVRGKAKWKFIVLIHLVLLNVTTKSLPLYSQQDENSLTTETAFTNPNVVTVEVPENVQVENDDKPSVVRSNITTFSNISRNSLLRDVRPGQQVRQYAISLTFDDDEFAGRAVIDVTITDATRGDPLLFHLDGVEVENVQTGVFTIASAVDADFDHDDGILEIEPVQDATSYIVIVEYTGELGNTGRGLYLGEGHDISYIGMNLHPTNARRVFPCMDDPSEPATVTFNFKGVDYNNIITNSILDDRNTVAGEHEFRALLGPVHTWGMVAHNFINLNIPTANVLLAGRQGVTNQDAQASIAINAYFTFLNDWTDTEFFEIVMNQETRLHVLALPDVDRDWNSLSTVGIWEPHILMENVASIKQRKTVLVKVAEALARQWFGYVIHPQNWRHDWVVSGFATYSAYEAVRSFQTTATGINDVTLLDMNTLFVTDVIQEALLRDSYTSSLALLPEEDLFDEDAIRDYLFSGHSLKTAALMHMMRVILSDDDDHDAVQVAAQALLTGRALETVSSQNFIDAMNSGLLVEGSDFIEDMEEYLEPWIQHSGYPLLNVGLRAGGVLLTQERFGFAPQQHVNFEIPITFTTSVEPNFDDDNIHPITMMDATTTLNMVLDEEDWVIFNIQGQGFYRVNYVPDLWERIIEALEDEEAREEIHPLNRATLVDDALNLARAGKLDYDIAFRVVLSMELETEYAVWKAFVRNMDFIRKRLVALVTEDEDLDPDIYLRMVRRTIGTLEDELGFYPELTVAEPAMVTLTRGLVMDHACRANYDGCIAAAEDWFYDPNNDDVVNPNIPYEIRPAVYCTMVREGDEDVIEALVERLEREASQYERIVILESLACSQDEDYIDELLMETVTPDNPYLTEERVKIFKAVAESSFENAHRAMAFLSRRAAEIREWYGGDEKLEEIIFHLADNMADEDLSTTFEIFVNSQNNNLEDSQLTASRALLQVKENSLWDENLRDYVYEWIDENDAPTLAVSLVLVGITFIITLFNN